MELSDLVCHLLVWSGAPVSMLSGVSWRLSFLYFTWRPMAVAKMGSSQMQRRHSICWTRFFQWKLNAGLLLRECFHVTQVLMPVQSGEKLRTSILTAANSSCMLLFFSWVSFLRISLYSRGCVYKHNVGCTPWFQPMLYLAFSTWALVGFFRTSVPLGMNGICHAFHIINFR